MASSAACSGAQQGHAVDGPFAQHQLHDGLAPSGKGDGRTAVVRVAPTANDRGIADPSGVLFRVPPVEVAAARLPSASSATAPTVSCEPAGSPVKVESGIPALARRLGFLEALPFAIDHQLGIVDQG